MAKGRPWEEAWEESQAGSWRAKENGALECCVEERLREHGSREQGSLEERPGEQGSLEEGSLGVGPRALGSPVGN